MDYALLQLGERLTAKMPHRRAQPPLERGGRIPTEVVVIRAVDRLDELLELEVEVLFVHGSTHYLGIQTRTSDRSFSTSSGFAM